MSPRVPALLASRTVAIAALLLALPMLSAASEVAPASNQFLQPGTEVETTEGYCTLNYVWVGGGSTYIGTAGHCVDGTGDRVSTSGHGAWGTVVLDLDNSADFALIRVDAAKVSAVRAAVQHWGGPTGVATAGETAAGDLLAIHGYGELFWLTEPTQSKQGVLLGDNAQSYTADTWAVPGDSGAPVLMKGSRKALGIISEFNLPISTDYGPSLDHIQAQMRANGWNLQLQTAPSTGALV